MPTMNVLKRRGLVQTLVMGLVVLTAPIAVQAAETVTIAVEDDFYPLARAPNGKLEGFSVDVIKAAFANQGYEVKFNIVPYARCTAETETGVQLACFNVPETEESRKLYIIPAEPLVQTVLQIFAPADSTASNLGFADLAGKRVGLTHGYDYSDEIESGTSFSLDVAKTDLLSLKKVAGGRVDYALLYDKVAAGLLSESGAELVGKVKVVGNLDPYPFHLAFSRQHPDGEKMADVFTKGLIAIKASGEYNAIDQQWNAKLSK